MVEEDIQNEEEDQGHHDYIEQWFQIVITSKHHYILQQLLVSDHFQLLVFHVFVYTKVYISNISMNVLFTPITHMVALEIILHLKEIFFCKK